MIVKKEEPKTGTQGLLDETTTSQGQKPMNPRMSAKDKRRAKIFEQAMRFAWEHDAPYHQTPVFYAWKYMMAKCYNPKHSEYPNEGGRGIDVCESWHRFSNFLADVGHPPASGEKQWAG